MSSERGSGPGAVGGETDVTVRRGPGFWLAYAAGWTLYSGLIVSAEISQGGSIRDSLLTVTIAALPGALLGVVVAARRRDFFRPDRGLLAMVGLHAVTGILYAAGSTLLTRLLILGVHGVSEGGREWGEIPFVLHLLTYLFLYVILAGFLMWSESIARVQESRAAAARESALRARAEARALRAQFNPHFVFNTLHSLMLLIRAEPATAERAIEDVASLIRYASRLQREGRDAVPLHEEMEFARRYLALEELRLEDRLTVEWEVDEALLDAAVPAFSLQTLLENAVKHGVAPRPEGGTILVRVARGDGGVELRVEDDGPGARDGAVRASDGQGLALLRQRVEVMYGEEGALEWRTAPGDGFRVSLRVPGSPPPEQRGLRTAVGAPSP